MLIYAQIYAGKTGSGLCCVGPVSASDVAHLSCVKSNMIRQIRQEEEMFGFQNKSRTFVTLENWGVDPSIHFCTCWFLLRVMGSDVSPSLHGVKVRLTHREHKSAHMGYFMYFWLPYE